MRSRVLAVSGAFILSASLGGVAQASGGNAPANPTVAPIATAPLTVDEKTIANLKGWTPAETRAYLRSADVVGDIAVAVAEKRPDVFVGSALSRDDPSGTPTLYVKGRADAYVRSLITQAGGSVVLADNQPYSRAELDEQTERTAKALEALGYVDYGVYADIQNQGTIVAVVKAGDGASTSMVSVQLPDDLGFETSITTTSAGEWANFAVTGGMQSGNANGPLCTTSFTVNRIAASGAARGILSAGHCQGVNRIYDHINDVFTTASLQEDHQEFWGDFEWYGTPANEADDFYADVFEKRDVSSVEPAAGISWNEPVCMFGWGSVLHDCSQVLTTGWSCLGVSRLVIMQRNMGAPGDSGGPWFYNNRAYGVEKGICDGLAVWSIADYSDEAVHAKIATT